jgi:hypothetical protein
MGRKTMTIMTITIIAEASLGLPPIFADMDLCSGCNAMASIRLQSMMLTKGYMIARHQPTIKIRMNSLMVVS